MRNDLKLNDARLVSAVLRSYQTNPTLGGASILPLVNDFYVRHGLHKKTAYKHLPLSHKNVCVCVCVWNVYMTILRMM